MRFSENRKQDRLEIKELMKRLLVLILKKQIRMKTSDCTIPPNNSREVRIANGNHPYQKSFDRF